MPAADEVALGVDEDGEVGRQVAVEGAADQEVGVAQGFGAQVARMVEQASANEREGLVGRAVQPGVDGAEVEVVALAAVEVQDIVELDSAARGSRMSR